MKTNFPSIVAAIVLGFDVFCVPTADAQLRSCRDRAITSITFDVSTEIELDLTREDWSLYVRVTWIMHNPQNATLDGYAVHFLDVETKRDHSITAYSVFPDSSCHSGNDHLWVSTDDLGACDAGLSLPQCSKGIVDACLCSQANCSLLLPLDCLSVMELLGPNYDHFTTVLPTTRSLLFPIEMYKDSEFSISPYYRKYANLSPTTIFIPQVTECDERILDQLPLGCSFFDWPPAHFTHFIASVTKINGNVSTTLIETKTNSICDLELCVVYSIKVFGNGTALISSTTSEMIGTLSTLLGTQTTPTPASTVVSSRETRTTSGYPSTVPGAGNKTTPATTVASRSTRKTTRRPFNSNMTTATDTKTSRVTTTMDYCSMIPCDEFARCVISEDESPTCVCDAGFSGDGFTCEAIDCSRQRISNFTFPSTQPGLVSYSVEKCEGASASQASIRCVILESSSFFDESTLVRINCGETIRSIISQGYNTSEQVSQALQHLQALTSDTERLDEDDIQEITAYFEGINTRPEFKSDDVKNAVEISSHLSEYYSGGSSEDSSLLKQSLVQSVTGISRKLESTTQGFEALSDRIIIKVQDVLNADLDTPVTFAAKFYTDSTSTTMSSPIEITIPGEAIMKAELQLNQESLARQSSSVRAVSVGYRNTSLFPSSKQTNWVIASSLGGKISAIDGISLNEPVIITNNEIKDQPEKTKRDEFKTDLTNLECVFWDFNKGSWSREGCCLVPDNPPKCHCNHLTNFAILVSKVEIPSNFALSIVTYVGCGLSVICLFCTVAVICFVRRLRSRRPMQVIVNICVCLVISFMFFLFGVDFTANETSCSVLAAFLHYFLLATWFWMAVYSYTVYRDVVKVLDSYGREYNMFAAAAVSYGIPFVIVALNAGITLGYIDKNQPTFSCDGKDPFVDSTYNSRNFCWLQKNSLYFGFLFLAGILLVYNIVIYCITIPRITCRKRQIQSSATPNSVKQNVMICLVMASTTGLSWIIGYLMLVADNQTYLTVMSWIFAVVNSFQGVFIFLFTVVRTGDVKHFFNSKFVSKEKTVSTSSTGIANSSGPKI